MRASRAALTRTVDSQGMQADIVIPAWQADEVILALQADIVILALQADIVILDSQGMQADMVDNRVILALIVERGGS